MGFKKRPVSPRQKMINLMYIVLLAMLALNVSSDVLKGFTLIQETLTKSTNNLTRHNDGLYLSLETQMQSNPAKAKVWYEKAQAIKAESDKLYQLAEQLKLEIAQKADGQEANPNALERKDDTEAGNVVMLSATGGKGILLQQAIDRYRNYILPFITDSVQRSIVADNLSTAVPRQADGIKRTWPTYMFGDMPAAATLALLTKLQSDVRQAEGEALRQTIHNIDVKDLRVNALEAFVIPSAQTIVQGGKFSAQIVLAAIDTTQRPEIYVNGARLTNSKGIYEAMAGSPGERSISGYIQMRSGTGDMLRRDFKYQYNVVAPSATVAADMMNVLYAGYDNPISISIPGVSVNQIVATASGGALRQTAAGKYSIKPSTPGQAVTITVSANTDGRMQEMGKFAFKVRRLPDPVAFVPYQGTSGRQEYRGGGRSRLPKAALLSATGLEAAIDDGLLNIPFRVTSFETIFYDNLGNAVVRAGNGGQFSDEQRNTFRALGSGKRFIITRIKAVGPDGISRDLPQAIDVIVQ